MLVHKHHTDGLVTPQPLSVVGEVWTTKSCHAYQPTWPSRPGC